MRKKSKPMNIFKSKMWRSVAWPLAFVYRCVIGLRNRAYDLGVFKVFYVEAKVISVGNLSVGGTGKTPATIFLAKKLQARGYRIAILSRGYGRTTRGPVLVSDGNKRLCRVNEAGDEPSLMALRLSGVPILVDSDRVRGARQLIAQFAPEIILLDDGFQHRRLARAIDIVLIDPHHYRRNPGLLPAGPYREPVASLQRAHLVWVVAQAAGDSAMAGEVSDRIKSCFAGVVSSAQICPSGIWDPHQEALHPMEILQNAQVFALAAIGQPEKFRDLILRANAELVHYEIKRDHHHYSQDDVDAVASAFSRSRAQYFLTTMKDWVKLSEFTIFAELPVLIPEICFSPENTAIAHILAAIDTMK